MTEEKAKGGWMLKQTLIGAMLLFMQAAYAKVELTVGSYSILMEILNHQSVFNEQHQQSEKVKAITQSLMGTPYNKHTLNGAQSSVEALIINLKAMDCMTFIEYTEAFKRSENYAQFISNLTHIRYVDQEVSFANRRHFFSDWLQGADAPVLDITTQISPHSVSVNKALNLKNNGNLLIAGLPIKQRVISYIPIKYVDDNLIKRLKTGDYIGIYAKDNGLDVSHVGIIIRDGDKVIFRNASSLKANLKVSDIELWRYLKGKTGIIVFRTK